MLVASASPAVGSPCLRRSPGSGRGGGGGGVRFGMTAARSAPVSVAPILKKLQRDCATPLPVLRHVAGAMAADMRAGLAADGGSDLKMILSYVDSLPSGYVCMGVWFLCMYGCMFEEFDLWVSSCIVAVSLWCLRCRFWVCDGSLM